MPTPDPDFPPFVEDSDTSYKAAASMLEAAETIGKRVYEAIWLYPRTCDEIEIILGLRHQTASARIRTLALKGHIEDSGDRRKTRSGRSAVVWKIKRNDNTQE